MFDFVDPTISTQREQIAYAPRPRSLKGLRVGLIENTKKNSETVLRRLAEKLAAMHGTRMELLVHKPQRAPLDEAQMAEIRNKSDFAITGVGD